ncbi:hypothetical protein MYX76_14655 [Desulfobacterota bacterium AH_259_B03_O07]|nr:hypothetical protein [Desulfobacterota bacterium AH_259_B03_O07]
MSLKEILFGGEEIGTPLTQYWRHATGSLFWINIGIIAWYPKDTSAG